MTFRRLLARLYGHPLKARGLVSQLKKEPNERLVEIIQRPSEERLRGKDLTENGRDRVTEAILTVEPLSGMTYVIGEPGHGKQEYLRPGLFEVRLQGP